MTENEVDIEIFKRDESFISFKTSHSIKAELREFFSFRPKNYQFSPKFKNRMWDGWIRLYNPYQNLLYLGLLAKTIEFCRTRNYSFRVDQSLIPQQDVSEDYPTKLAESLGVPFTPYDYQNAYVKHMINTNRCIIQSPTGSGKSLIAYLVGSHYKTKHALRTLVIVPTVSLVMQMQNDFIEYGCNPDEIHIIKSGSEINSECEFVISTWQSIHRIKDKNWINQFGVIIGDEAHTFQAKSLTTIMTNANQVQYKFGMTGTIKSDEDQKVHRLVLEGLFGPVKKIVQTSDLIADGTLASIKIKALVLNYDKPFCSELAAIKRKLKGDNTKKKYSEEVEFVNNIPERNIFIRNLVKSLDNQNNLILFNKVEKHGKPLQKILQFDGRMLHFVHGGIVAEKREEIRHLVENDNIQIVRIEYDNKVVKDHQYEELIPIGNEKIPANEMSIGLATKFGIVSKIDLVTIPNKRHNILASTGVFSTGVNIKRIDNIIFASGGKSEIIVIQSIGRGLRKGNFSDDLTLYDIADNLTYGNQPNYLLDHFKSRIGIYRNENHPVKIYQIPISKKQ